MAILLAGTSSYTATGEVDPSAGISIPLPANMAVGDYIIAAVSFAQVAATNLTITTPAGWTILNSGNYGSASNHLLVLYGYKIYNASSLSAIGSSFTAKSSGTSTRIVANVHRLTGVDLTQTPSLGAIEYSASDASTVTFNQPNSGTKKFYFLANNNNSPSAPPTVSSTNGTVIVTNRSAENTGVTADSQLTTLSDGTGATYSTAVADHVSYGISFTQLTATVVKTTTVTAAYVSSKAISFTAPAIGNGLVAVIQHQASSAITVTDNVGNTWTKRAASESATPTAASGQYKIDIWDCLSSALSSAPTSLTVATSATSVIGITIYEITGVNQLSAAQAFNASGIASTPPSFTPKSGDLIITSAAYYNSSNTAAVASPYTLVAGSGVSTTRYDSAYYVAASSSSTAPSWTASGSTNGAGFAATSYGLINNTPPTPGFSQSASGLTVSVTSSASDPDGSIASTDYDWGDGTPHGTSANASHTYATAGTYTITQTVIDNAAASATYSLTVTVSESIAVRPTVTGSPTVGASNSGTSLTIARPAIISDGDWLIAALRAQDASASADFSASGWTRIGVGFTASSPAARVMGFYAKRISSATSETATSYTFSWTGGSSRAVGLIGVVHGANATNLVEASSTTYATSVTTNGTRQSPLTVADNNSLQLLLAANEQTSPNASASTSHTDGFTLVKAAATSNDTSVSRTTIEVYQKYQDAGSTTQFDITWSATSAQNVQSVVLKGAANGNVSPVANFSFSVSGPTITVTSSANDSDGSIASTDYDWGDNTAHGTSANGSHTYSATGTYTVIQTVTDNSGAKSTATYPVVITTLNITPISSFTYIASPLSIRVDGSGSSDPDGTITSYDWNWGDGSLHGSGAIATHSYAAVGTYTVTLTVTDNSGLTASMSTSVAITSSYPAPTRIGYAVLNPGVSNTLLTVDPSSVAGGSGLQTGHWMVAVVSTTITNTSSISPPSGWTTLLGMTTANTLRYAVFAKIRQAGESTYTFTLDGGGTSAVVTICWGSGADTILSNWVVGANTNRSSDYDNIAASITTKTDHTLVLGISVERTTANESSISGISGATEWYFVPQSTASQLETIDIAYIADVTPAGATPSIDWTYPNPYAPNGMAIQIGIAPPLMQTTAGYSGILHTNSNNYTGRLFYWDGSKAYDFTTTPIVKFKPVTVTQFLSQQHSPWFAAHRGFSYSYPEETLYGYRGATDWGIKAIEVSVQKSQDGTFWCFHDSTTTRTTGTSGTISSMTDATIAALTNLGSTAAGNSSQPARPTAKLVDVLNNYAATHVIIIEDKTYANTTSLLNLMDSYGTSGRPATEIFIWKVDGGAGASFYTPAASRGYHRWAYIFDSSMSSTFSGLVTSGKADMIGLDFNSSDQTLSSAIADCKANNVRPTGHIVSSITQRDRLLGLGMTGIMMSNKDAVPPWYTSWGNY